MGRVRSKLKRNKKGKTWIKGESSTSNPQQMKHRLKAKSRFFQPNLSLASTDAQATPNALTQNALAKHDQIQAYNAETTTVNDVAGSLKSFTIDDDDEMPGTFQTYETFASTYSNCSNMTFKKLLMGFRTSSELHKEMLAILSALTEIIHERGGTESSTEYFILLMEQIEASTEERDIIAGLALLSMGMKTVPAAVLRNRFDQTINTLSTLLTRFVESNNQSVIRYLIVCMSLVLRAQDYTTWTYPSTLKYFDAVLAFTIHSKPKIRKGAQHAIVAIMFGSSFVLPPYPRQQVQQSQDGQPKVSYHPASTRVSKFCLAQFKPEMLANAQTVVLHTLQLLKSTLSSFRNEDIRIVCENLLSIMTAANVMVRSNCFETIHELFSSRTTNLSGKLAAKLIAAIHEYRPNRSDVRQTIAWLTVLKEGQIHLGSLDLDLCINGMPRLFEVCTNDLWLTDNTELRNAVSNCIKQLLQNSLAGACHNPELAQKYRGHISRIISYMHKALNAPFGEVTKHVIIMFSVVFESCGREFKVELSPALATIAKRYDSQSAIRLQIEHTMISGIKELGPECVLQAVPLCNPGDDIISLDKSWLLPLLRKGANGASLQFFKEHIISMAARCLVKWQEALAAKNQSWAHTYELFCCQLWGLFPGFCRRPKDPEYLRQLAPTLGLALDKNPEFRAPIYDGLMELLHSRQSDECHEEIIKYARNFLPRLFNIYTQKPTTTYEADLRPRVLEVIREYIARAPEEVQAELFTTAQTQLANSAVASFEYDALFDINAASVLMQKNRGITEFFEKFIAPVLRNDKSKLVARDEQKLKKQQLKTYELLRELLTSEQASCQKFKRVNSIAIQKLLLDAFNTSSTVCQAARLHCLKTLLDSRSKLTYNDQLVTKVIPEAVLNYKELSTRKENIAEQLIKMISDLYQEAKKINDFVDILTAGFTGDGALITNTILAFRAVLQQQGKELTVSTLEFILQQISVFLVQKSRNQAEAAVAFYITFIKVMPIPLVANHMETIMRSLSAMTKDTKRYCRIQIGYFLKKLCKRFTTEELARYVPGDDEITHRRLKKIRKQMRRDSRKNQNGEDGATGDSSDDELMNGVEQNADTIEDILADSDSDLPDDMDSTENEEKPKDKGKSKRKPTTIIREDPDEIVDLADLKSVGNVLTSGSTAVGEQKSLRLKKKLPNGGFKTAEDGRLIIDDKGTRGKRNHSDNDDTDSDEFDSGNEDDSDANAKSKYAKQGMETDSSDEEELKANAFETPNQRKRKASEALSMRSGKTNNSRGKGIHRALDSGEAMSVKSGRTAKSATSAATGGVKPGTEYTSKKAKGDMKKRGKLEPYAYIPLTRNLLNKRKRPFHSRQFKNIVSGRVNKQSPKK